MKKRYLVSALLGSTLLLGACNQGDDDSKHHNDKRKHLIKRKIRNLIRLIVQNLKSLIEI